MSSSSSAGAGVGGDGAAAGKSREKNASSASVVTVPDPPSRANHVAARGHRLAARRPPRRQRSNLPSGVARGAAARGRRRRGLPPPRARRISPPRRATPRTPRPIGPRSEVQPRARARAARATTASRARRRRGRTDPDVGWRRAHVRPGARRRGRRNRLSRRSGVSSGGRRESLLGTPCERTPIDSPDDEGRGTERGVPRARGSFPTRGARARARAFDRAEAEDLRDEKDTVATSATLARASPCPRRRSRRRRGAPDRRRTPGAPRPRSPSERGPAALRGARAGTRSAPWIARGPRRAPPPRNGERVDRRRAPPAPRRGAAGGWSGRPGRARMSGTARGEIARRRRGGGGSGASRPGERRSPSARRERARLGAGQGAVPLVVALFASPALARVVAFGAAAFSLSCSSTGRGREGVRGRARSLHPDNARGGTPCRESILVASEAAAHAAKRRDSWFPRASPSEYSLARLDRGSRARLAPRRVRAPRGLSPPRRFVPPTSPGKRQIRVGGPHNLSRRRDRLARETRLAPRRRSSPGCRAHARALLGAHSARHLGARHASRSARPRRALVPPALPPRVSARPEMRPRTKPRRAAAEVPPRRLEMADDEARARAPCSAWTPGRRRRRYARRIARRRCAGTQTRIPTIRGGRRDAPRGGVRERSTRGDARVREPVRSIRAADPRGARTALAAGPRLLPRRRATGARTRRRAASARASAPAGSTATVEIFREAFGGRDPFADAWLGDESPWPPFLGDPFFADARAAGRASRARSPFGAFGSATGFGRGLLRGRVRRRERLADAARGGFAGAARARGAPSASGSARRRRRRRQVHDAHGDDQRASRDSDDDDDTPRGRARGDVHGRARGRGVPGGRRGAEGPRRDRRGRRRRTPHGVAAARRHRRGY